MHKRSPLDVEPIKKCIALRLSEWITFKEVVENLHRHNPTIVNITPRFFIQTNPQIAACTEYVRHTLR